MCALSGCLTWNYSVAIEFLSLALKLCNIKMAKYAQCMTDLMEGELGEERRIIAGLNHYNYSH